MYSFLSDELVWAMQREREEEARNVRPHFSRKPDVERLSSEEAGHSTLTFWIERLVHPGLFSPR